MQKNIRLIISFIVILVFIPLSLYAGITIFADRKYYLYRLSL
ncbi:ECF transporter S component OS=Lysinibacillus sphaericus OX=1421 GN=LS41612_12305 PE=4 SV=1 [Lysinibacillus sphaericus]